MPIYEYQCQACGHHLEVIQSFADNALTDCPACQKAELNKLISAPSFHLKGTGWYATDFKNSAKKSAEASDKTGTDGSGTAAAGSTAEKPTEKAGTTAV